MSGCDDCAWAPAVGAIAALVVLVVAGVGAGGVGGDVAERAPVVSSAGGSAGPHLSAPPVAAAGDTGSAVEGLVAARAGATAPTARFTFAPSDPVVGEPVQFNASNSTDPEVNITEYRWDFDGDDAFENVTTDPTVTHTFDSAGLYNVRLVVVNELNETDTAVRDVTVDEAPTARCTVDPTSIRPNGEVTVDATDSTNAEAIRYDFDGDGTYDTDTLTTFRVNSSRTADEEYAEPGEYTPVVKVIGPDGRTDTAPCPTVTVGEPNAPPRASFSVSPRPAVSGEATELNAVASTDDDGRIVEYRWDFDNDGTYENVTSDPIITHRFDYAKTGPSTVVVLTVVDDDGATDTVERTVEVVRPPVVARCTVEPTDLPPGESVTIDARDSENAESYRFDFDGDGEFDTDRIGEAVLTRVYDQPGNYTPRVRVYGPDGERTDTAACGDVTVRASNEPPQAVAATIPGSPTSGTAVALDASNSTDVDGRIVEYRWDLDGDGTVDRTTNTSVLNHSFGSAGTRTVRLVVVDDDGATDSTTLSVAVREPGDGAEDKGGSPLPGPAWLVPGVLGGGGAGYLACRGRDIDIQTFSNPFKGGSKGGVTAYATGTFDAPATSTTVTVDGLGFEPDVLLFAAASGPADRTDGWTHGKAVRVDDSTITQNVVSVATDTGGGARAGGAVRTGQVLDLLVHGDESMTGLAGAVTATMQDGFELRLDASALPDGAGVGGTTVAYRAFEIPDGADAAIGHTVVPAAPGVREVDVGIDANFVALTATDAVGEVDTAATGAAPVAVCHGTAVGDGANQQVQTSTVDPGDAMTGGFGAHTDRALHLLDVADGAVAGRTTARVTGLGETLALTFDETDCVTAATTAADGSGETAAAGGALVTFVALDADEQAPEVGAVEFPAAEAGGRQSVALGRRPGLVSFTTLPAARRGADRVVPGAGLSFGWSHGTALRLADGSVAQDVVQSAVDPELVARYGRLLTGAAEEGAASEGQPPDGASADGGTDSGAGDGASGETAAGTAGAPSLPPAVATVPALDDTGAITGWDALAVTSFDDRGFTLASTSVSSPTRQRASERPLVCYTAWPLLDEEGGS